MYKEIMSQIRLSNPKMQTALVSDFKESFPTLVRAYTSHISAFLDVQTEMTEYETPSKKLFYTELRQKLMALSAQVENELPECPKCKTNEFMGTIAVQTRSADEAATLFPKCMKCQTVLRDCPLNS